MAVLRSGGTLLPDDLVALVADRKVIPFVGAGFSAGLGLPTWEELLRKISDDLEESIPYDELRKLAHNDNLQIAEFLYLRSHKQVGPLRHVIERSMPNVDPLRSGVHVELINLHAPQIYTTNYDDLIELTFRQLDLPVSVVTMPRDVSAASADTTQVVKYHGDLRHDETLVLTESSYYRRLDFESPMDLKFRSDLLGRSVLFMGYSFRDINIRIIWYKLTQMMRDIPEDDRRPSYIVRLEPNAVLEELDRAVGLRTIILDPDGTATTDDERSELLARFLFELSSSAFGTGANEERPAFVSAHLIERVQADLGSEDEPFGRVDSRAVVALLARQLPEKLKEGLAPSYAAIARSNYVPVQVRANALKRFANVYGPSPELTATVAGLLLNRYIADRLIASEDFPWDVVWNNELDESEAGRALRRFEQELNYHQEENIDSDLAYAVDILTRIRRGQLTVSEDSVSEAERLLDEAAQLYPIISEYEPSPTGPPDVSELIEVMEERARDLGVEMDEPPF